MSNRLENGVDTCYICKTLCTIKEGIVRYGCRIHLDCWTDLKRQGNTQRREVERAMMLQSKTRGVL